MKKRTTLIGALLVAVTVLAVPFLYANAGEHLHRHGRGSFGAMEHLGKMSVALNLTEQQTEEIRAIFKEARKQNAPYRSQLREGYREVAGALLRNPNDLTAAQSVIDRQLDAERTMKTNMLQAASRAISVLNAQQRIQLGEIMARHAAIPER